MNNELEWWTGEGGDSYMRRNDWTTSELARRVESWDKVFCHLVPLPKTIMEIGPGPGINLRVLNY